MPCLRSKRCPAVHGRHYLSRVALEQSIRNLDQCLFVSRSVRARANMLCYQLAIYARRCRCVLVASRPLSLRPRGNLMLSSNICISYSLSFFSYQHITDSNLLSLVRSYRLTAAPAVGASGYISPSIPLRVLAPLRSLRPLLLPSCGLRPFGAPPCAPLKSGER